MNGDDGRSLDGTKYTKEFDAVLTKFKDTAERHMVEASEQEDYYKAKALEAHREFSRYANIENRTAKQEEAFTRAYKDFISNQDNASEAREDYDRAYSKVSRLRNVTNRDGEVYINGLRHQKYETVSMAELMKRSKR